MSTLATLAVNVEAGTANFTGPMKDAAKTMEQFGYSTAAGQKIFNATRTDAERYAQQIEKLDAMLAKGAISQDVYDRAVEKANEKLEQSGHAAEHAAEGHEGLRHAIEAVGAVLIVDKLREWSSELMESVVATEHMAQTLGVSTQQMGELQYAAKLTETPVEALSTGLGKLQKTLVEVSEGVSESKGAAAALKSLKLNAEDLASMDGPRQLTAIGDALNTIENPAKRSAIAMELLGRGGRELIPLLKLGSQGMEELFREADRTGNALNEVQTQKVAEAHREIARAVLEAKGALTELLVEVSPAISEAAHWVRENQSLVASIGGVTGAVAAGVLILPRLTEGISAVGSIAKTAIANPIGVVAVGAVSLFTATMARSIVMNESWEQSAYHVLRTLGLFHSETQDLAESMNEYGAAANAAGLIARSGFADLSIADRIEKNHALTEALEHQLAVGKEIIGTAKGEETTGIGAKQIHDIQRRLKDAKDVGKALEELQAKRRLADLLSGQEKPGGNSEDYGLNAARKSAEDAAAYVQRLRDQLNGLHKDGDSVELEKLGREFQDLGNRIAESGGKLPRAAYQSMMQDFRDLAKSLGEARAALQDLKVPKIDEELDKFFDGVDTKAGENLKRLQEDAKHIFEETRTPAEKFAETQAHLKTLLDKGAIDFDTYERAITKAREAMDSLHRSQQNAKEVGFGIDLHTLAEFGGGKGGRGSHASRAARHEPFDGVANPAAGPGGAGGANGPFQFGDPFSKQGGSGWQWQKDPFGNLPGAPKPTSDALSASPAPTTEQQEMLRLQRLIQQDVQTLRQQGLGLVN